MLDFTPLDRPKLEAMAPAGAEILQCPRLLPRSRDTLLAGVLRGAAGFGAWTHYPEGDVYDPLSHAQYFYHAHPTAQRLAREHGHFHTFLRPRGMPPGTRPLMMPELAIADAPAAPAGPAVPPAAQPNPGGARRPRRWTPRGPTSPAGPRSPGGSGWRDARRGCYGTRRCFVPATTRQSRAECGKNGRA